MNASGIWKRLAGSGLWLAVAAWLLWPAGAAGALEETFDVLQIGTRTFKNVTVTTKAKDYIFILHSAGMTSVKVKDLSPELRHTLGYAEQPAPTSGNTPGLLKKEFEKFNLSKIGQLAKAWRNPEWRGSPALIAPRPSTLFVFVATALLLYGFFCYCCGLICQKAGRPPGPLVWVPMVQLIPLLRAAGLSPWWFVAWFVPVLNLVAYVLLSVKLVQARGKSIGVAVLLLLPVASLFAFLYLAFSDPVTPKEKPVVEIMTLDAA